MSTRSRPLIIFLTIASATVLGIAGTDLVLPAVPLLPDVLGGSEAKAQYVLAAYALGTALGLITFGELGSHFQPSRLLGISLVLFAAISVAASLSRNLEILIGWRFAQGAIGAAPAVFAPGFIRSTFGDGDAPKAMGWLGSVESLAPALAPVVGLLLLQIGGWRFSFWLLSAAALACAIASVMFLKNEPQPSRKTAGGYWVLLRDSVFRRYWLSQSLCLASILIFVFGAPVVVTQAEALPIEAFITMQIVGVSCFIAGSLASSQLARRVGTSRLILAGTAMVAASFAIIWLVASVGIQTLPIVVVLFALGNFGFGLRGPIGFHQAILAAKGDDGRAAALVVLLILISVAAGTAVIAPHLLLGFAPLAAISALTARSASLALLLSRQHAFGT